MLVLLERGYLEADLGMTDLYICRKSGTCGCIRPKCACSVESMYTPTLDSHLVCLHQTHALSSAIAFSTMTTHMKNPAKLALNSFDFLP